VVQLPLRDDKAIRGRINRPLELLGRDVLLNHHVVVEANGVDAKLLLDAL
jgi:hypothetical protein